MGSTATSGSITVGNFNISFRDDGPKGFRMKVNAVTKRTQVTLLTLTGGEEGRKPYVDVQVYEPADQLTNTPKANPIRTQVEHPIMD